MTNPIPEWLTSASLSDLLAERPVSNVHPSLHMYYTNGLVFSKLLDLGFVPSESVFILNLNMYISSYFLTIAKGNRDTVVLKRTVLTYLKRITASRYCDVDFAPVVDKGSRMVRQGVYRFRLFICTNHLSQFKSSRLRIF